MVTGSPVFAEEASTEAEVQVLPQDNTLYGYKVIDSENTIQAHNALLAPDENGTIIITNGWIEIQFEEKVTTSNKISVWAANIGWHHSMMKVYISEDGNKWKLIANQKVEIDKYQRFDFIGNFKNVKYIKINREGGILSLLLLDAVGILRG